MLTYKEAAQEVRTYNFQLTGMNTTRGLISKEHNFADNSKPGIYKTVDIHSDVPRHVKVVVF